MQNARSYLGRFSGLALFLIALLVVGLLVVFTIRSTNDDEGTVTTNDGTASTESPENGGPAAIPDLDSEAPGAEEDTPENEGNQGTVAGEQDGLPNTGPEDALIPATVLGLLVFQGLKYRESRKLLSRAGIN